MSSTRAVKPTPVAINRENDVDRTTKISKKVLLNFTQRLNELFRSGITLTDALDELINSAAKPSFKRVLESINADVRNGRPLSEAMSRFPNIFSPDYTALILAGERTGKFCRSKRGGETEDGILDMLVKYLKRKGTARDKIKTGLTYPAIIGIVIVITLLIFSFFIFPAVKLIFEQIGVKKESISILTRFMLWFSDFTQEFWYVFPIAIVGLIVGFIYAAKSETGQKLWMHYQLRVPLLGSIFQKMSIGETYWLMGTLFAAGLTPQDVLGVALKAASNREISNSLERAKSDFHNGTSFCDAIRQCHTVFQGDAFTVLSSAQKTGNLDNSLQDYASQLFEQIDEEMQRLIQSIEPVMIIIGGVVVALIAISFYGGLSSAIGNLASGH